MDKEYTLGQKVREEQSKWGLTDKMLARELNISVKKTLELIHDELELTPTLARKLRRVFGIEDSYWLELAEKTAKK